MSTFLQIIERDGLPASVHTEKVILGAMLSDPLAVVQAIESLVADDFSLDSHRRIYGAMLIVSGQGKAVDFVTIGNELLQRKELEVVGGRPYLIALTEDLPRHLAIGNYVDVVKSKAMLRKMMQLCEAGLNRAADISESADSVQTFLSRGMESLVLSANDTAMEHISEFAAERYPTPEAMFEVTEKTRGLRTGFTLFDELTLGLHRGELIILAARPSMGKTAFVTSLCGNFVDSQTRGAIFPLEQGKESMLRRMACGRARASFKDLRAGTSSDLDRAYIAEEMEKIKNSSLYWNDAPATTISKIRARMIRKHREIQEAMGEDDGLQVGIIDQLSWVDHGDLDPKKQNHERLGDIAKGGKKIAKELNIPVILVCQLGRPDSKTVEVREPRMSDLAESGKLEQHADVVLFLHRPEYYNREDETLKGRGILIVEKNRDGQTGRIEMTFNGSCTLWADASPTTSGMLDWNKVKSTPPDYTRDTPPASAYTEF